MMMAVLEDSEGAVACLLGPTGDIRWNDAAAGLLLVGVDPPDAAIVRTDSLLERVQIRRDMIPIRVLVLDAVEVVGDDLVHQGDLGLNLRRLDGRDLDGAELLGHGLVRLLDAADLRRQRQLVRRTAALCSDSGRTMLAR